MTTIIASQVALPIHDSFVLEYLVYPELIAPKDYRSTHVGFDLVFESGRRASEMALRDQNGFAIDSESQASSNTLFPSQWNFRRIDLSPFAGDKLESIELHLGGVEPGADASALVGGVRVGPSSAPIRPAGGSSLSSFVRTTRGTNSSSLYSRGGCFPAVSVPHGFNFYSPVTDAKALDWIYSFGPETLIDGLDRLEAFAISHLPSPWIGDRAVVQFFPASSSSRPCADGSNRSLQFERRLEVDLPYMYDVTFVNGMRVRMAPTSHALVTEFEFPDGDGVVIFDNPTGAGHVEYLAGASALVGFSDVASDLSEGTSRFFFFASFDEPVIEFEWMPEARRGTSCAFVRFASSAGRVRMVIGTSFISSDQARSNGIEEIGSGSTVDAVAVEAQKQWDAQLQRISLTGATATQKTTFYSNLYRVFLYPNAQHETVEAGRTVHRVPTNSLTDGVEGDGPLFVNNGFWDTYRTVWPLYALLSPELCGQLLDGFVNHFKDTGWIPRWSAPGPSNIMVGTSSDIVIADALAKNVRNFDIQSAYEASVKNATVPSLDERVGRKASKTSRFRGFTSSTLDEGLSWTLEGSINDFGIAEQSLWLMRHLGSDHKEWPRLHSNELYFRNRAMAYIHLFDQSVGFFRGRTDNGEWRESTEQFDPKEWGNDYTETNAWNMAFSVPHDLEGLISLHGGHEGLARKLDEFFLTEETALIDNAGSYKRIIHEMSEARDARLGMLGLPNQPSHHIPYLYAVAGQPHKTQKLVRRCLETLFVGSEIGQGYLGDEDNGELSAWYVFGALGLYPLSVGTPEYVLTSPLFDEVRLSLSPERDLTITATNNSAENVYIQSLTVDGRPHESCFITHEDLTSASRLNFVLGPDPSDWGRADPKRGEQRAPLSDKTPDAISIVCDGADADFLVDDRGDRSLLLITGSTLTLRFRDDVSIEFYTITCGDVVSEGEWVLEASSDGDSWELIDERRTESFAWESQVRPFACQVRPDARYFRLTYDGQLPLTLTQIELYG